MAADAEALAVARRSITGRRSTNGRTSRASADIVDVPIQATSGQYVRGWWLAQLDEIGTAEPGANGPVVSVPRVWTNVSDWQQLVWREDGINFTLSSGGSIGEIDAPASCALDQDDFAAVAQSLQPAGAKAQ